MKYNRIASIALIGSVLLLAASCVKEISSNEDLYRPAGTPISFSAASGYENAPETRAEYSDIVYGGTLNATTPVYERIDWRVGDKIQIVHNGTAAPYTVASYSNNDPEDRESNATLSGGDLVWDGASGHTFYGLYPSGNGAAGSLTTAGVVSGTIPATQNIVASNTISATEGGVTYNKYRPNTAQYGYMAAYASIAANSNASAVRLPFRPAFTTFEFKLQRASGEPDPAITSFELKTVEVNGSTTPLTGGFSFQISGGDNWGATWTTPAASSITNPGNTITVGGFGASGVHVPTTGYLDFSVLALPINLTGVELIVHYASGESKTLTFKNAGVWHTFTGAKKYVITNSAVPGGDWEYVIEELGDRSFVGHTQIDTINYTVKSYKYNKLDPSVKVEVPWKTQYRLYDAATDTWSAWADVASNGNISGSDYLINNSGVTGNGSYTTGEDRSAQLHGNSVPTGDEEHSPATIIADLAGRTAKGSPSDPWDLSMYDIFGNAHSQTTANSYIVTAPGTYKFPVVYGNAITNGITDYTEAYWPASRGGSEEGRSSQISSVYFNHASSNTFRYLARFIRADGQFMSQARIDTDMSPTNANAAIVWQNRMELTPGEATGPIVQESSVSYSNGYITFTVAPADIRPGNVVIAFRGDVSGLPANSILWSWQIWICPDDLTPVQFPNGALLPYNLGYIDSTGAGILNYPNRLIQFKLVQVENNVQHDTTDFTIEQIGDGRAWDASVGFNVYYQWGRKDPMIPAKDYGYTTLTPPSPATGTRDVYPDADIYPGTGYTINVHGTEIAGGIATPFVSLPITGYVNGITQPYVAFINTYSTGWVGGSINGYIDGNNTTAASPLIDQLSRQFSSIACNLWNNGVYTTMDGTNAMWKTVYDPCPPGFCVPTAGVLGNLTAANLVARTSDGAYFSTPNGTRLFMPYSGLRVYYADATAGNYLLWAEEVRRSGWYWTDTNNADVNTTTINLTTSAQYARSFSFGRTNINPILPVASSQLYTRGSSLAIRPMVDPKYQ